MVLLDSSNPSWDKKVSSYILANACVPLSEDTNFESSEEEDLAVDGAEQFEIGVSSTGRDSNSRRLEETSSFSTWSLMRYVSCTLSGFLKPKLFFVLTGYKRTYHIPKKHFIQY